MLILCKIHDIEETIRSMDEKECLIRQVKIFRCLMANKYPNWRYVKRAQRFIALNLIGEFKKDL